MKTYSFIGSDKNAGKTTAFNYVCRVLSDTAGPQKLCISSIGINGEGLDQYEGTKKPHIRLIKDQYFITALEHLNKHTGKYQTIGTFNVPTFRKLYIMGKCLLPFNCVIEGPNTGSEILKLKQYLSDCFSEEIVFLIDGSADRQFIANPDISDAFYFSILFSQRKPQQKKAEDFLFSLRLPECHEDIRQIIASAKTKTTKSLIIVEDQIVYHGKDMPFCDDNLLKMIIDKQAQHLTIYINGALTQSLYGFLAPFRQSAVILDNFTLYLNVTTQPETIKTFYPKLSLLHPVRIKTIFVKQETEYDINLLPKNIEVINLYRDEFCGIGTGD